MHSINVITFGLPKILQAILDDTFEKQDKVDLVGHFASIKEFEDDHDVSQPNVVIVEEQKDENCRDILYRYPHARVVSVRQLGKRCAVWQLIPRKQELGEMSSDQLASLISSL